MSIIENTVLVGVSGRTTKHYESLGYVIPSHISSSGKKSFITGAKFEVLVSDLLKSSDARITKKCDLCKKENFTSYSNYNKSKKNFSDGQDRCRSCATRDYRLFNPNKTYKRKAACVTHPEFAKLFWDLNDASLYTAQSGKKIDFKCPNCNSRVKGKVISNVFNQGLSCHKCSDGISYPEKFVRSLLEQLGFYFSVEKRFEWALDKKYDFYIPSLEIIIEVHGIQHYEGDQFRELKEEIENDLMKKNLAINNGFSETKYIVVDARYSNLDYLKKSLKNNDKITSVFDVSVIDFLKCHEYGLKSIIKEACLLYELDKTVKEIAGILKISVDSVRNYLRKGNEVNLCNFEPDESKKVLQYDLENNFLSEFLNVEKASKAVGVSYSSIYKCCTGKRKTSKGFKWKYKKDIINKL